MGRLFKTAVCDSVVTGCLEVLVLREVVCVCYWGLPVTVRCYDSVSVTRCL